ncbi:MAG: hypothetical protein KUG77_03590 [Nannocystaceae bacterium]|nr:hypothetical protein [Nannocystaceae bacterium]
MDCRRFLPLILLLAACVADPREVVGNVGEAELEPLEGTPSDGVPVFEVTVDARISPAYDRSVEGEPVGGRLSLFHCGAMAYADEGEVRVRAGTVDVQDVGAIVIADYDSFSDQDLYLGGAGPFSLSIVYDTSGTAVYSESGTWNESGPRLGVFPRALDGGTSLFELAPGEPHMLTLLDPTASYDEATQTLTTQYEFQTESGQQHSVTETYSFSGRYLVAAQSQPWMCE